MLKLVQYGVGEEVTTVHHGYSTCDLSRPWYKAIISRVFLNPSIRSNIYDLEFMDGSGDVELAVYQCYIKKCV